MTFQENQICANKNLENSMHFDPNNDVVRLCTKGMELEVGQDSNEAQKQFLQAWNEATNDFEKFTAAHFRRPQPTFLRRYLSAEKAFLATIYNVSFAYIAVDIAQLSGSSDLYL